MNTHDPDPYGIPKTKVVRTQKYLALALAIAAWMAVPVVLILPSTFSLPVRVAGAAASWIVLAAMAWRVYPYPPLRTMLKMSDYRTMQAILEDERDG